MHNYVIFNPKWMKPLLIFLTLDELNIKIGFSHVSLPESVILENEPLTSLSLQSKMLKTLEIHI